MRLLLSLARILLWAAAALLLAPTILILVFRFVASRDAAQDLIRKSITWTFGFIVNIAMSLRRVAAGLHGPCRHETRGQKCRYLRLR